MTDTVSYTPVGKARRTAMYEYVRAKGRGWVSIKEMAIDLGISRSVAYHFVNKMIKEGFFESKKVAIHRITNVFIRLNSEYADGLPDEPVKELPEVIPSPEAHVRLIRLLDNPLPKPEESKKKTKVYVGSSMNLI
jgi:hypothetical protein